MNNNENDDAFNRADRMPPLLAICNPLNECDAEGIIEHQLRRCKVDPMLRFVGFIFSAIPFDPHVLTTL